MDIETVIKRPFSDWKTMALGSLASIIPGWVFGYGLKCAKDRSSSLPDLSDFGNIFVQGLLAAVITFIWSIPAVAVMFITMGMTLFAMMAGGAMKSGGGIAGALGGMGVGILFFIALLLLTSYLNPVVVLNFGKKGFGGGFEFGTIFRIAFTGEYFKAWIISTVLATAVWLAGWIAMLILTFTVILAPVSFVALLVALFAMIVIMFTMLGETYDKLSK